MFRIILLTISEKLTVGMHAVDTPWTDKISSTALHILICRWLVVCLLIPQIFFRPKQLGDVRELRC